MSDVTKKRERQARRLLRVCLREFEDGCLESYVDDFEGGKLKPVMHCALDAMSGADSDYRGFRNSNGRAAAHVEHIFAGYGLFFNTPLQEDDAGLGYPRWDQVDDATRRRWIYEACIEELARRRSEDAATSASERVRAKLEATR